MNVDTWVKKYRSIKRWKGRMNKIRIKVLKEGLRTKDLTKEDVTECAIWRVAVKYRRVTRSSKITYCTVV